MRAHSLDGHSIACSLEAWGSWQLECGNGEEAEDEEELTSTSLIVVIL